MNKSRQSNFELMRIISMIFIVMWHFLYHGGLFNNSVGITNYLSVILYALLIIHVNSFVLLTGYFNHDKSFKLSKIVKLNNSMWFYKVLILVLFIIFTSMPFTKSFIIKTVSPIPRFNDYWFIVLYIILYLISPALNLVIENGGKDKHKKIIVVLLIISFLALITENEFIFGVNGGFSLFSFILLYFIGAYLHKYPIEKTKLFRSKNKKKIILISFLLYAFLALINCLLYLIGRGHTESSNFIIGHISRIFVDGFSAYSNPLIIAESVFYFVIFSQLNFKNRFINLVSKNVLGVYLITENFILRPWIYNYLGYDLEQYSIVYLGLAIIYSLGIFGVCVLFEILRSLVFKFFYDRKISGKLRNKIKKLFKKVNINW